MIIIWYRGWINHLKIKIAAIAEKSIGPITAKRLKGDKIGSVKP